MATFGFKDESYSKRTVSETDIYQVAMASDITVTGVPMIGFTPGAEKINIQNGNVIRKDTGRVQVLKKGYYRVSAEVDISAVDSDVTFIDALVRESTSGTIVKGTVPGAGGTFIGTMTAGPKIVLLEANARLQLSVNRRGSGSVTAKGLTSNLTVEWVADAEA